MTKSKSGASISDLNWIFFLIVFLASFAFVLFSLLEPSDLTSSFEKEIRKEFIVPPNRRPKNRLPKTLVIYFPQYHRDPVNDRNWGDNFTDWDSLRNSPETNRLNRPIPRPLTEIPKNVSGKNLPPPLGYYDLTDRRPRETQGALAKKYGIDGFIYHHYWFYDPKDPGPTLAKPLENMLEDGHPDVPFMLNWCASTWVNVWMGKPIFQTGPTNRKRMLVLQQQYFNATDDMIYQHYQWLKPFFHHPNYIRVDGQPAFLTYMYNPESLPILETLRKFAIEDGFPGLHFIAGRSSHHEDLYETSHVMSIEKARFDFRNRQRRESTDPTKTASEVRSIYSEEEEPPINESQDEGPEKKVWDYNPLNQTMTYPYPLVYLTKPYEVPKWCMKPGEPIPDGNSTTAIPMPPQAHPEIIGLVTAFDNSPRRPAQEAKIWLGAKPDIGETPDEAIERFSRSYEAALYYQKCCATSSTSSNEAQVSVSRRLRPLENSKTNDRFVAINSMNEWAEGMAIEPSNVYGYRWLETIQAVQKKVKSQRCVVA